MTPAALLLAALFVFPAMWAVYVSMTDLALLDASARDPQFIGLDNYRRLWNDPDILLYLENSAVVVLGSAIVGQSGLGLLLALLFRHAWSRGARLAGVALAAVLAAWISPPLLTGYLWGRIVDSRDGVVNGLLDQLGLGSIDLLGNHAMSTVLAVETWRGTAFAVLLFLGGLAGLPRDIYEAASTDGASAPARFADLTLPLMRPTIALVVVMTAINAAGSFISILVLTNGDPGRQTETLALFSYHRAFQFFEIGFGSAISVVLLAFNAICAVLLLALVRGRR
jgi:multiple sugar transport system permease protein